MEGILWYVVGVIFIAFILGNIVGAFYIVKVKWDDLCKFMFSRSSREEDI